MLAMAVGAEVNAEDTQNATEFSDVTSGEWYVPYINWAAEAGVVTGKSAGVFAPDEEVTREEIAKMISLASGWLANEAAAATAASSLSDFSAISDWAQNGVAALHARGVVSGDEAGAFNPDDYATRAEVAKMLCATI
jgi:hypothetical protein